MKKLYIYLMGLLFISGMYSCQDVNDKFDNLDKISAPPNDEKESYTLVSDDYETIADFALDKNPDDILNADTIANYQFFSNSVAAAEYIPAFLADKYPAFGFQSSAVVTYNFNPDNDYPLYQERFDDAEIYEVDSADYAFVSVETAEYQAFTPSYPADEHLPVLLARAYAGNSDVDYVFANYRISDGKTTTIFQGDMSADLSGFTTVNVLGAQIWEWASYGGGCGTMTGYDGGDFANEDWLITPGIDLTSFSGGITLSFDQAINYLDGVATDILDVLISTNFNGSDVAAATWTSIADQVSWPSANGWDFIPAGEISIDDFAGQTIYIAFKYECGTTDTPTWEVNNIKVFAGSSPIESGDYYENDNGSFTKVKGVYVLTSADYESLGAPGKYHNFSDDEPADAYLPDFLTGIFTTPYVGQIEKIAYKEYSGGTNYIVDEYEYTGAATWQKYTPIIEKTDQFIVDNTGNWVFDPTILNIMSSADFQLIVDFVKENYGESYVNSYGTGETYHGADAYYVNFDIRDGHIDASVFETWQDALTSALGIAFLPTKYPDAQMQVDGIDQLFIIEFDTYSGVDGHHKWVFQVTEAAPNPVFTFVEELE